MADEDFLGCRFFRILLSDFSSKMSIPNDLAKQLSKEQNRDKATLVSHNGKIWHVDLFKEEMIKMYMGGGKWKEFVQANNLEAGYLLILRYRGNFVFSFRVFDRSTCEQTRQSPSNQKIVKRNNIGNDHPESENHQLTASKKKLKSQELVLKNAHFDIIIKSWHISQGVVLIPVGFIKTCGISKQHKEVSVRDLKGKWWQLGLHHSEYRSSVTKISRGWKEFAQGNKLEEGDKLVFELVSSQGENKTVKLRLHKV